jgi:hypothetical protein
MELKREMVILMPGSVHTFPIRKEHEPEYAKIFKATMTDSINGKNSIGDWNGFVFDSRAILGFYFRDLGNPADKLQKNMERLIDLAEKEIGEGEDWKSD